MERECADTARRNARQVWLRQGKPAEKRKSQPQNKHKSASSRHDTEPIEVITLAEAKALTLLAEQD